MIVEYDQKYDEQIKDLLVELQNYLIDIDDWHTQIMSPKYREKAYEMDMKKVKEQNGKVFVSVENGIVNGVIMGIVNENDEVDKLTNDYAKIGMVLELIVSKADRGKGTGKKLLEKMEEYFKQINCARVNIEVFGPNKRGLEFYKKNDYIVRDMIVSKRLGK